MDIAAFLAEPALGKPLWAWLLFLGLVMLLLWLDLAVLHRKTHKISLRESLLTYGGYVALALCFGLWIWHEMGGEAAMAYYTGYFIEQSLAMDNLFVISLVFAAFGVPAIHQHRVLFWGILGVVLLRGIMIGVGAALVANFHWVLYFFGAFLVFTGIKMLVMGDKEPDVANNRMLLWLKRRMRVTDGVRGEHFFVREPDPVRGGKPLLWATPLFMALLAIEVIDLVFAVDSVPAIFAITTDPYLVYTSNIFAILGLRTLYFALSAMLHRFRYLKPALALVLIVIGAKIFLNDIVGKIDPAISLAVTLSILGGGVVFSLVKTRREGGGAESVST